MDISIGRSEVLDKNGNYNSEIDEIRAEDSGYLSVTQTGSTKLYDTPSNCKAHIRTLIIYNKEASDNIYTFTDGDGGSNLFIVKVASDSLLTLTNLKGFVSSNDIYVKCTTYTNGSDISIGVIVENNEIIE